MTKDAATPQNDTTAYLVKRLLRTYVKPFRAVILRSLVLMALAGAMTAAIAQLMQPILDDVLGEGNTGMIIPVAAAVFGAFGLRGFSTYGYTVSMEKVSQSIIGQVQKDLFAHMMTLDLSFFHKNPSGKLLTHLISDVDVMRKALSDTLTGLGKSLTTMIFLIMVMLYQDWKLTLAAFFILPFIAGFVAYLGKRLRRISGNTQEALGTLADRLSQVFQAVRQVKAYGMESHETLRSGQSIENVRRHFIKSVRVGSLSTPVNEILIGLVLMGVIIYGGYQASAGNMTPGQLGAFLAAFIMAYEPMKKISRLNNALQTGLGATARVFTLLDETPQIVSRENARVLDTPAPVIEFKDVQFLYEGMEANALNKISFKVEHGKVTALVGPSGGGKSTIINLIPRFYDVTGGAVTVDGHDLRDLDIPSLRRHIALVSQDISIFNDTVMANIAYGRPDATEEEIIQAAKDAAAHDFIEKLSGGYQTILGEDGSKLSGGQRQRISIARAILRGAPILLLDEATSALDNESEQTVQKALKKLEKGRTTIVIAHRLSTVRDADQILVMNQGEITEQGKHEDLMARGGLYAKMYAMGFREDDAEQPA